MHVIFSPKHRQHAPPVEFVSAGLGPYSESPSRADSILATLEASGRFDIAEPVEHADAARETGTDSGEGANVNLPLPPHVVDGDYLRILAEALVEIRAFSPAALVLSLGVDTCIDDPLGDFDLSLDAFSHIGRAVASLNLPTLAVQEGGYAIAEVGEAVLNVLTALQ